MRKTTEIAQGTGRSPSGRRTAQSVWLSIPAKPEYIGLCRLALVGLSRELPDDVLGDLKLAVTEACTNSVRHAYEDGAGVVDILYELHADCVVIEVSDAGCGFRPGRVAAADNETGRGLGLAIIDSLADELEISERPGGGSRLRFVKILAA